MRWASPPCFHTQVTDDLKERLGLDFGLPANTLEIVERGN